VAGLRRRHGSRHVEAGQAAADSGSSAAATLRSTRRTSAITSTLSWPSPVPDRRRSARAMEGFVNVNRLTPSPPTVIHGRHAATPPRRHAAAVAGGSARIAAREEGACRRSFTIEREALRRSAHLRLLDCWAAATRTGEDLRF
jgi:hypothetical protein